MGVADGVIEPRFGTAIGLASVGIIDIDSLRNFKDTLAVYPDAKVEIVAGGLMLKKSQPVVSISAVHDIRPPYK